MHLPTRPPRSASFFFFTTQHTLSPSGTLASVLLSDDVRILLLTAMHTIYKLPHVHNSARHPLRAMTAAWFAWSAVPEFRGQLQHSAASATAAAAAAAASNVTERKMRVWLASLVDAIKDPE